MSASLRLSNPLCAAAWLALYWPGRLLGESGDKVLSAGLVLAALLVLAAKDAPWESRAPSRAATGLFGLILLAASGSFMFAAAFKGVEADAVQWMGLLRWVGLWLFALLLIRGCDESSRRALENALFALPFVSLLALAAFHLELPLLGPLARALYHDAGWLAAPFDRPEQLGAALALGLFSVPAGRGERATAAHAAASTAALALTGDRGAWLSAGLGLAAWAGLAASDAARRRRLARPRALGAALFLVLAGGGLLAARLARPTPVHGAAEAAAAPDPVRELFRGSPLLGWGHSTRAEAHAGSQLSLWLLRGGLLGLGLIVAGLAAAAWRLRPGAAAHAGSAAALLTAFAALLAVTPFLESDRLAALCGLLAASAPRRAA